MKSSVKSKPLKLTPLQNEDVIHNPGNPDSEMGIWWKIVDWNLRRKRREASRLYRTKPSSIIREILKSL